MKKIKYTNEQEKLLNDLKKYISKNGVPKAKDFRLSNGLRSYKHYRNVFNNISLKDILEMAGVSISDKEKRLHYSKRKNITNEELLKIMRDYNDKIKFPTQRAFTAKNGLPSYSVYCSRFGSFKNAIRLAGIKIPKNKKWLFERQSLTDNEIKIQIKNFVDDYILKENKLPTYKEIDSYKHLPSTSVIVKRFGSLTNLYKILGYDLEHETQMFKKQLLYEYIQLAKKLDRTPTSRDLDKYSSKGVCCSASAYMHHFGSIYNIQLESGCTPVNIGKNKTDKELINDIRILANKLNRIPLQKDLLKSNNMASNAVYRNRFGSWHKTLRLAGFSEDEINSNIRITKNGTVCCSIYEYKLAHVLETNHINFKKEEMYKNYIHNFDRNYRFDFTVFNNNRRYFVEIFGIVNNKNYDLRTKEKIKLCRDNNIPLIDLYPSIFWSATQDELFFYLKKRIKNIDKQFYNSKEGDKNGKTNNNKRRAMG